MKQYFVYILTNSRNTVFYIGITNSLERRVNEHKFKHNPGFTKKYNVTKLVYFEECPNIKDALAREKQLKNWHREWKINLIKNHNPSMSDLSEQHDTQPDSEKAKP